MIMNKISLINLILILMIIILAANLISPISDNVGKALYNYDTAIAQCYFNKDGGLNVIPIDICCQEIQKQLSCDSIKMEGFNFKCYISKVSERYYLLNHKALNYCKKEGYNVQID